MSQGNKLPHLGRSRHSHFCGDATAKSCRLRLGGRYLWDAAARKADDEDLSAPLGYFQGFLEGSATNWIVDDIDALWSFFLPCTQPELELAAIVRTNHLNDKACADMLVRIPVNQGYKGQKDATKHYTFMRFRRGVSGCCDVSMTASAPNLFSASALLLPRHTATTFAPMALQICTAAQSPQSHKSLMRPMDWTFSKTKLALG